MKSDTKGSDASNAHIIYIIYELKGHIHWIG